MFIFHQHFGTYLNQCLSLCTLHWYFSGKAHTWLLFWGFIISGFFCLPFFYTLSLW